uniref:Meiosis-specific nuclear structural protein 1 n=1 Tax=Lygus hesperus TaxID=30085 RepID=A0A0A9W5D4_LYGHE
MMEELAAAAKMEQYTKQKQRDLKAQHIAETQKRLQERQVLKERELEEERRVNELDKKREAELQEYIRRARMQLLEEHIPKLGNFAPYRYLRDDEKLHFASISAGQRM